MARRMALEAAWTAGAGERSECSGFSCGSCSRMCWRPRTGRPARSRRVSSTMRSRERKCHPLSGEVYEVRAREAGAVTHGASSWRRSARKTPRGYAVGAERVQGGSAGSGGRRKWAHLGDADVASELAVVGEGEGSGGAQPVGTVQGSGGGKAPRGKRTSRSPWRSR